jgi:hypothetical protein
MHESYPGSATPASTAFLHGVQFTAWLSSREPSPPVALPPTPQIAPVAWSRRACAEERSNRKHAPDYPSKSIKSHKFLLSPLRVESLILRGKAFLLIPTFISPHREAHQSYPRVSGTYGLLSSAPLSLDADQSKLLKPTAQLQESTLTQLSPEILVSASILFRSSTSCSPRF